MTCRRRWDGEETGGSGGAAPADAHVFGVSGEVGRELELASVRVDAGARHSQPPRVTSFFAVDFTVIVSVLMLWSPRNQTSEIIRGTLIGIQ